MPGVAFAVFRAGPVDRYIRGFHGVVLHFTCLEGGLDIVACRLFFCQSMGRDFCCWRVCMGGTFGVFLYGRLCDHR